MYATRDKHISSWGRETVNNMVELSHNTVKQLTNIRSEVTASGHSIFIGRQCII